MPIIQKHAASPQPNTRCDNFVSLILQMTLRSVQETFASCQAQCSPKAQKRRTNRSDVARTVWHGGYFENPVFREFRLPTSRPLARSLPFPIFLPFLFFHSSKWTLQL
jgi:hypothetical protein